MIGHSRCVYCTSNCSKRFSPEDRKKRYCERNNLPYEKPKKEIKIKIKKEKKKKVKIPVKPKIYSEGYLKQIEEMRLKSKRINDKKKTEKI